MADSIRKTISATPEGWADIDDLTELFDPHNRSGNIVDAANFCTVVDRMVKNGEEITREKIILAFGPKYAKTHLANKK